MSKTLIPILVVVLFLSTSTIFAEENVIEYSNVSGWNISIDLSLSGACFAYAEYEDDSILRVGFNEEISGLYIIFGNAIWQSIEYGKKYDIQIKFGEETPWNGQATGLSFDPPENQPFLAISIDGDPDSTSLFIEEFMEQRYVRLFYDGKTIENLTLKGSYSAGLELIECQAFSNEYFKDLNSTSDPFSSPDEDNDPFNI